MSGRWIIATDNALVGSFAKIRRLERIELRDNEHVTGVARSYSLDIFAPGYIGVAAIIAGLHFVPLPQPWGLITWVALSYSFGLAAFHLALGLSGQVLERLPGSLNLDKVATWLAVAAILASLTVFSFVAPSPINQLYA
jgi:hypothetical protein